MSLFISSFFDWIVGIINAINSYPIYSVLFLIPIGYLVISVIKKILS